MCGNPTPINVTLNTDLKLSGGINCTTSNIASGSYIIYKNNAVIVPSTIGFICNYKFTTCGTYKIVFSGKCGTTTCTSTCEINFNVPCIIAPTCGSWLQLKYYKDGVDQGLISCDNKIGRAHV